MNMCSEILGQVEVKFCILDLENHSVDPDLGKKTKIFILKLQETTPNNIKLHNIITSL